MADEESSHPYEANAPESSDWFSEVYAELRMLATAWMAREQPGQTLDATALVNEAWCKLAGDSSDKLADRRYFFAAAGLRVSVDGYR